MTTTPADQDVRDAAATELGRTMFIEAGAGTGKTTMLISRLLHLITTRAARMDEIAAITFTEAAAAELRDRLIEKLEQCPSGGADDPVRDALSAIDGAAITTLHGFARRLLTEHPFAVGLPPVFEVTDATGSQVAFDERWDEFISDLLHTPEHEELVVRALSCGLQWTQLRKAALQCEENWDRLEPVSTGLLPPAFDAGAIRVNLEAALDQRGHCAAADDKLMLHLEERVVPALDALGDAADPIDLLQILIGLPKLTTSKGQAANWTSRPGVNHKLDVCALLESAEEERRRVVDLTVQWAMRELFGLVVARTLAAAKARRTSGRLMFHDLLVLARQLVRDHPEARQELHERYTHLLIDEFQDTDPIQVELAMHLAAGPAADASQDWAEFPVDAGRLFFVGDPKQSIYRFRRADIEVFMTTRDRVAGGAAQLVANFRSRPEIVTWFNAVFGEMFGSGSPGMQPAYEALVSSDDRGTANPRGLRPVIVLGQEPIDANAEVVRQQQTAEVADAIATMHAERWPVRHGDEAPSALRFSDVAILVPTRTGMDVLEGALRAAGVPFRLESSSLVYESQEVRDLLSILRAIDDPTDVVSVVAALRSPAFGCGDDDLLHHVVAGGGWDARVPAGGSGVVSAALAVLGDYHQQRWWAGVGTLVGQVVADRRLLELALVNDRPRESWRRIRFVVDQARVFEENAGGDLRAFLRWVGHQQDDEARVTEVILPETDDDAVRISTIHAAKGLEFPVTVLLGLERSSGTSRSPLLFGTQPEVYLNSTFATPGHDALHDIEKEMDRCERIRLFYVAATRACDVLLVSLHRKAEKRATMASQVTELCQKFPELWSDGTELTAITPTTAQRPGPPVDDDMDTREGFIAARARLLSRAAVPRVVAATGVAHLGRVAAAPAGDIQGEEEAEPSDGSDGSSVRRRGRAGTAVGRAVHGVLQLVDLTHGDGLSSLARLQAVAEGVPGREAEVRELARVALESDLVRRAVESGRYWREVYLGVPIGERVLEGFIDLLFETPEGLWIVDYKTDRLRDEDDAERVAERYHLQGAAYARAAQAVLGKEVAGCFFLFLRSSGAVAVPLPDLPGAVAEVDAIFANSRA
jgi:ATP-dependent helicase/nuclease subunit A